MVPAGPNRSALLAAPHRIVAAGRAPVGAAFSTGSEASDMYDSAVDNDTGPAGAADRRTAGPVRRAGPPGRSVRPVRRAGPPGPLAARTGARPGYGWPEFTGLFGTARARPPLPP
ncbi:hypothetical protein Athai_09070 [Actinocatenispora thailandica]|uniref:Uncharacterized protein n=1 Tax=Actinocatenispora thailandica TaxID=227318 RepID=A0A7R7DKG8_9ACTN|nr:hypothetical protein Athai_09070 [Actinocatenispora thailandica]